MRTPAAMLLLAAICSAALAQNVDLNLDSVAAKAAEKSEIVLDGPTLALLKGVINQKADARAREMFEKVDAVSIRSYEFDERGKYSDADLAPVRAQLTGAKGWSRVLKSKDSQDDTEIYIQSQGGQPKGFLLISAEPKELTVVQISGLIEIAQMQELIKSTIKYAGVSQ